MFFFLEEVWLAWCEFHLIVSKVTGSNSFNAVSFSLDFPWVAHGNRRVIGPRIHSCIRAGPVRRRNLLSTGETNNGRTKFMFGG